MYTSIKFASETEELIEIVRNRFFSEYSFVAKGTIISRSVEMFKDKGCDFLANLCTLKLSATNATRVNLTAHALEFINQLAQKNDLSKTEVIHAILSAVVTGSSKEQVSLMTWNIDWGRNGKRTQKNNFFREEDTDPKSFQQIIKKVKDFLTKENSVCFLQEVPYYVKNNNSWEKAALYKELVRAFPSAEYDIFWGKEKGYTLHQSIAISKKDMSCQQIPLSWANNRVVAVKMGRNLLVGVHMPTHFLTGDQNDELWKNLVNFVKNNKDPLCIVGDFNAYIGCSCALTNQHFIELIHYVGEISPSVDTFEGGTHIDHVLTSNLSIISYSGNVQKDFTDSDHKYIQITLDYQ